MNGLNFIVHAVTFGASRAICMHPRTITHERMTQEEHNTAGVDDGLIRLSVGLENAGGYYRWTWSRRCVRRDSVVRDTWCVMRDRVRA